MKELFKENRIFLIPWLLIVSATGVLLIFYSKAQIHIFTNQFHTAFADTFFKYITHIGDGVFIALMFIALLFVKYRYAFSFLSGALAASLVTNLIKKVFLDDVYRPSMYFQLFETYKLHLVEGVKLREYYSFPSGHSATAFNLFFMLALLVKNRWLKFIFLIIAMVVGYSRVYLSQHFLIDVVAGSVVGVVSIYVAFYYFSKSPKGWLDQSILKRER
jgi:membrane-associated phospholipid phosphatase